LQTSAQLMAESSSTPASSTKQVSVTVITMSGEQIGSFAIDFSQSISALKQMIADKGGPEPFDQQLLAGHRILADTDSGEELVGSGGIVLLVTVLGCPTCKGPCFCSLCNVKPTVGLIDYYGVCKECGKCGGHASKCKMCNQAFASLCALDTHMRFAHNAENVDKHSVNRFNEHIERRSQPGFTMPKIEKGTFREHVRGGL